MFLRCLALTALESQLWSAFSLERKGELQVNLSLRSRQSSSGRVIICGEETNDVGLPARIGVCPQHDCLWQNITVEEHLRFFCVLRNITKSMREALHHLGPPNSGALTASRSPHQISFRWPKATTLYCDRLFRGDPSHPAGRYRSLSALQLTFWQNQQLGLTLMCGEPSGASSSASHP